MIRNGALSNDLFAHVLDSPLKTDRHYLHKRQSLTTTLPVHYFSFPFSRNHVQQGLPQVISNAAIAHNLVTKNNQAQIVDVLHIVLLHIHAVLQQRHTQAIKLQTQDTHAHQNCQKLVISTEIIQLIFSFSIQRNCEYPHNSKSVPSSKASLTKKMLRSLSTAFTSPPTDDIHGTI